MESKQPTLIIAAVCTCLAASLYSIEAGADTFSIDLEGFVGTYSVDDPDGPFPPQAWDLGNVIMLDGNPVGIDAVSVTVVLTGWMNYPVAVDGTVLPIIANFAGTQFGGVWLPTDGVSGRATWYFHPSEYTLDSDGYFTFSYKTQIYGGIPIWTVDAGAKFFTTTDPYFTNCSACEVATPGIVELFSAVFVYEGVVVPEPTSALLFGAGALLVGRTLRRRLPSS